MARNVPETSGRNWPGNRLACLFQSARCTGMGSVDGWKEGGSRRARDAAIGCGLDGVFNLQACTPCGIM